jgi:hypothetical protein
MRPLLRHAAQPASRDDRGCPLGVWCGGAACGALPRDWRRRRWAGPVYELVVWLGFELGIAPVLGLSQAKRARPVDRLALAGDQLLYGVVLTATWPNAGKLAISGRLAVPGDSVT